MGNPVKVTVSADYNWLPFLTTVRDNDFDDLGIATHRIERVRTDDGVG